jgi:hypothetical protein
MLVMSATAFMCKSCGMVEFGTPANIQKPQQQQQQPKPKPKTDSGTP